MAEESSHQEEHEDSGTLTSILHWGNLLWLAPLGFAAQGAVRLATLGDKNRRLAGLMYRKVAVTYAKVSPAWDFDVLKPIPEYRPSNTVVISNHQSQADPFLISALPWEMKWMAKKTVFQIPIIGWSIGMAGDIPVVRGNRESGQKALEKCAEYLQRGMPVMIFPEGTRSRDGELLPFKSGAFRLAIENGSDILPLAVMGSSKAFPKGSWKVSKAKAYVAVGEPISTQGLTLDDVHALRDRSRDAVEALRQRIIQEKLSSSCG